MKIKKNFNKIEFYNKIKKIDLDIAGNIYLCGNKVIDSEHKIIKEINWLGINQIEINQMKKELEKLKLINSKYFLKYFDFHINKNNDKLKILYHNIKYENIKKILSNKKTNKFKEDNIKNLISQILYILKELSLKNITHKNICSDNLFLSWDLKNIIIGNFAIEKIADKYKSLFLKLPYYASPEVLSSYNYNSKSDLWSFGILLYEIMNFKLPFYEKSLHLLLYKIKIGKFKKPINNYSAQLNNICYDILRKNINERPSIDKLMGYNILKIINKKKINKINLKKSLVIKKLNMKKIQNIAPTKKNNFIIKTKHNKNKSINEIKEINNDAKNILSMVENFDNKLQNSSCFKPNINDSDVFNPFLMSSNNDLKPNDPIKENNLIDITEEVSIIQSDIDDLKYTKINEFGLEKYTLLYETIITFLDSEKEKTDCFENDVWNIVKKNNNIKSNLKEIKQITDIILKERLFPNKNEKY